MAKKNLSPVEFTQDQKYREFAACYLIALLFVILISWNSYGDIIRLEWDDTENEGHLGYYLYYGFISQEWATEPIYLDNDNPSPYLNKIRIPNPDARSYEIDLPPGSYYFRLTAYGSFPDVGESSFSNEVTNGTSEMLSIPPPPSSVDASGASSIVFPLPPISVDAPSFVSTVFPPSVTSVGVSASDSIIFPDAVTGVTK